MQHIINQNSDQTMQDYLSTVLGICFNVKVVISLFCLHFHLSNHEIQMSTTATVFAGYFRLMLTGYRD